MNEEWDESDYGDGSRIEEEASAPLFVARIKIENFQNTREAEIKLGDFVIVNPQPKEGQPPLLGTFTTISGPNETGKSALINALRNVIEGGSDAISMIRRGAKKAVITIELSDGTSVTKTIHPNSIDITIMQPGSIVPEKKPQTIINSIFEKLAIDPFPLITAKGKKVAEELLRVIPLTFTTEELAQAIGPVPPGTVFTLEQVEAKLNELMESRKAAGSRSEEALSTYTKLTRDLKDVTTDKTDWRAKIIEQQAALTAHSAHWQKRRTDARGSLDDAIRDIDRRAELERQAARDLHDDNQALIDMECQAKNDEITSALSAAQTNAIHVGAVTTQRQLAIDSQKKAEDWETKRDEYDAAIKKLRELKTRKLTNLPFDGMDFIDGELCINTIPWEVVNTAQRAEIAFAILERRCGGKVPFFLMDDSNIFDDHNLKRLKEWAIGQGYQVVIARVETVKDKLEIVTEGAPKQ